MSKPKLPRKRKKCYIKSRSRILYLNIVNNNNPSYHWMYMCDNKFIKNVSWSGIGDIKKIMKITEYW